MTKERIKGALSDLKVVEFDGLGPTPFSAMQLADMGASVIRISRKSGTQAANQYTDVVFRNRPYVELNLKDNEDLEMARGLIAKADVLVEGFRPGVMERLGLGPEELLKNNPKLVFARMTGWGQKGPLSHTAGHDINYISLSGALHAIGTKNTPIAPLNLLGDFAAGSMYLVFGILCAVLHAKKTGQGQVVDGSIVDGTANLMAMMYSMFHFNQWEDSREANMLDGGAPFYTTYKTSDHRDISVGAIEDKFYLEFITKLGLKFDDLPNRNEKSNWLKLKSIFQEKIALKTMREWEKIFYGSDACVAPVLTFKEAFTDPHNSYRKIFPKAFDIRQPKPAPDLSLTPAPPINTDHLKKIEMKDISKIWTGNKI
jgi:alpha-methylacyl-CoA racemase